MKVKCTNDNFEKVKAEILAQSAGLKINFPVKGEIYPLRTIFDKDKDNGGLETSYLLEGLYNPTFFIPVLGIRRELAFAHWRFEILEEDISEEETVSEEEKLFVHN
jgi:hypothetical protein